MMRLVLVFVMTAVTELCPLLAINRPSSTADERQLTGSYQGHQRKTRSSQMGRKSPLGGHGWISSPERRETATSGHWQFYVQVSPGTSNRCFAHGQLGRAGLQVLWIPFSDRELDNSQ